MAIVDNIGGVPIILAQGKLGVSSNIGRFRLGLSKIGQKFNGYGIYRKNGRWRKQTTVLMRSYRPTNPKTEAQQNNRTTFSQGVQAWHELTEKTKQDWREFAKGRHVGGFQAFMSDYMSCH